MSNTIALHVTESLQEYLARFGVTGIIAMDHGLQSSTFTDFCTKYGKNYMYLTPYSPPAERTVQSVKKQL